MSYGDHSDKKMGHVEATKVARVMIQEDSSYLIIKDHCLRRMKERGINHRDIINVLLGGKCTGVELHNLSGCWVYRFETKNYRIECNIFKNESIVAITAIRKRRTYR